MERNKLIHLHTYNVYNGSPKKPNVNDIDRGEIAICTKSGSERIFFKNTVKDNYGNIKEEVVSLINEDEMSKKFIKGQFPSDFEKRVNDLENDINENTLVEEKSYIDIKNKLGNI